MTYGASACRGGGGGGGGLVDYLHKQAQNLGMVVTQLTRLQMLQ